MFALVAAARNTRSAVARWQTKIASLLGSWASGGGSIPAGSSPGVPVELPFQCNVCGERVEKFLAFGRQNRPNVRCPHCRALDRHRAFWCYAKHFTNLFDGQPKKLLHVAPEKVLSEKLQALPGLDYLSADLDSELAMVKMDLTSIEYPDQTWDIILCSHVLEHIPDDRKAMREMLRVLRPGGWLMVQVPVRPEPTYEDWNITTPEGRLEAFGQADHVRIYGYDLLDRLVESGFDAEMIQVGKVLPKSEMTFHGIRPRAILFHCKRPV